MPRGQRADRADVDHAELDAAPAIGEVLEQLRLIDPVVDRQARRGEVAGKLERLLPAEVVPVASVRRAGLVPVVHAELALPGPRAMVMGDRVREPSLPHFVGRALGVEGRAQPSLLEQQREVEPRGAGSHDPDVAPRAHAGLAPPAAAALILAVSANCSNCTMAPSRTRNT